MIDVVVPVHNRRALTLACLRALSTQREAPHRVVVVDDGSTDGTSEAIAEDFPGVEVLRGDGNLWWSASVNLGIAHCLARAEPPDYLLLLNDDTEFEPDFLATLERIARGMPRALVGALAVSVTEPHQVLWAGGAPLRTPREELRGVIRARTLPGRATLVPRSAFADVGLIDARAFPHYFADVDFSLRARRAGYQLLCCCDAVQRVHAEQTAVGGRYRSASLVEFLTSFANDKSPNHLSTLLRFHLRHFGFGSFALALLRIVGGDLLRRLGLRRLGLRR
jgi:GT2 family glycosyltransferase